MYALGNLRNLVRAGEIRESHIVRLNDELRKRLHIEAVEIDKDITMGKLGSGKQYAIAVFDFKKEGKKIKALFLKDHTNSAGLIAKDREELKRFGIRTDTDIGHLDYPGLEGIWFVNPGLARRESEYATDMAKTGIDTGLRNGLDPALFKKDRRGSLLMSVPVLERIINGVHPGRVVGSMRYLADSDGFIAVLGYKEQYREDVDIMLINQLGSKRKDELIAELLAELKKHGIVKISQDWSFVTVKFPGYEKNVELHIMGDWYASIIYDAAKQQSIRLRALQQIREKVIEPPSSEKTIKIYLSVCYYFGDPELYARRLREYLSCKNRPELTQLKKTIFRQDLDVLSERMRGLSDEEMYERVIERLSLRSALDPFLAVASPSAQAEAGRIHTENLKIEYMPTIPDKTILCHIITDSIVTAEQQNMLRVVLEQNMEKEMAKKGADYREGIACLSGFNAANPDEYIKDLQSLMQKKRDDYKAMGYTDVRFDVACPNTGLVNAIIGRNLGVKALAFEPCKGSDFNLTQVEGIMLALRALYSEDISKLKAVFVSLSKNELTPEQSAITDIDKFVKTVSFILPAAKIEDYNERKRLNDLIATNIKQAA